MERDDAPSKRLVLCVSSIHRSSSANPTVPSSKQADPEAEVCLPRITCTYPSSSLVTDQLFKLLVISICLVNLLF